MSGPAWAAFLLAGAVGVALVGVNYWRREPAARARWVLGGLRASALLLLLLLLFDPGTPSGDDRAAREVVLLDASLSMTAPGPDGSRWDEAVRRARAAADRVLLFGDGAEPLSSDSIPDAPRHTRSSAVEAVRVAAEAGARRVVVVTDGEVEDAGAAASAARRAGIELRWEVVSGEPAPNAALAEFEAPRWGEPGDSADASVAVATRGLASDETLRVEIRHGDTLLGVASIPATAAGGLVRVRVRFAVPGAAGSDARLDARVVPGGAHADDDVRTAYMRVAEEGGGVVVLAFRPDWEPRFLLPALEAATGLRTASYLASADGAWLRAGPRAGRIGAAAVASVARGADLLVLLGAGPALPDWASDLVRGGPPLVLLPSEDGSPAGLPVAGAAAADGEWYLADQPPASPLAAILGSLVVDSLPPLSAVRPVSPGAPAHGVALAARRGRRGPETPVLVVGERGRDRWAAPLATGFWRWSLRGGRSRAGYRQLWSAVAGWLLGAETTRADEPIRPLRQVVARGEHQEWAVRIPGETLTVTFTPEGGGAPLVRVAPIDDGAAALEALPPGHYAWEGSAGGSEPSVRGALTVESYTREFARPAAPLEDVGSAGGDGATRAAATRPLHASPWAWLLVVALLCAEWILRRREGLR
ncbi:MAG TPA: hypothetical protein VK837_13785 [Longimicrobiales bacterium]|nr:hypothetical protein [Longimicrobiales bacterium]